MRFTPSTHSQLATGRDAGVVADHMGCPVRIERGVPQLVDVTGLRHVDDHPGDLGSGREPGHCRVERSLLDVAEHDLHPLSRELPPQSQPDPGSPTGDNRNPTSKRFHQTLQEEERRLDARDDARHERKAAGGRPPGGGPGRPPVRSEGLGDPTSAVVGGRRTHLIEQQRCSS